MKTLFKKIFLNVFLLPFFSFATVTTKLGDKIKVDGIIESKEWEGAQSFDIKYEYEPGYNTLPPFKTTAYVTYSDTKLYVAFDAKIEDIKYLRASIRERDTGFMDDWVGIALDTYGDNRSLIIIGSNAYGSQIDLKETLGSDGDMSYNINYETKGVIGEDGYVVEMAIPFSELQYEKKDILKWKALFIRHSWKESRIGASSNKFDRGNDCTPCQIDTYIELEGVNPKKRLEFLPYVSGNYVGSSDGNKISYDKPNFKAGLSARYDFSTSTALDFTINPDFSQVEADVTRININSPFAVNYPERRPFFNEGNDILSSYGAAVYTRSINNPIFASKLVNQGSKQRVYFLTSYDRDTPYLVPGENRSYFGKGEGSFGNILRYQRTFENGSNVGFLSTNRFYNGGGMGNMFGVDAKIRFNKTYNLDFVYGNSFSEEPNKDWISSSDVIEGKTVALDGEKFSGNALSIGFNRISEHWATSIDYDQLSPLFRADMGFITQNNFREFSFEQGYFNRRDKKVTNYFAKIETEIRYNSSGKLKRVHLLPIYSMSFKNGFSFNYAYSYNVFEEYNGDEFKNFATNFIAFKYTPTEKLSIFSRNLIGRSIAYNISNPEIGKRMRLNLSINYRPNDKLSFSPSISSESMKYMGSNEKIYSGYIFRLNSKYQFSNDLSFKLVTEYNDFNSLLFMQPLLKWNPNPSTVFYIGGNTQINYLKDNDDRWVTDNSQLFLKLQYLFKIN
ncbi:MAG: DUF5916 domain-containing protein [Cytophagales bacterium]|nr:DUF5916 domain-containing protein [Cytophagales bacterium]